MSFGGNGVSADKVINNIHKKAEMFGLKINWKVVDPVMRKVIENSYRNPGKSYALGFGTKRKAMEFFNKVLKPYGFSGRVIEEPGRGATLIIKYGGFKKSAVIQHKNELKKEIPNLPYVSVIIPPGENVDLSQAIEFSQLNNNLDKIKFAHNNGLPVALHVDTTKNLHLLTGKLKLLGFRVNKDYKIEADERGGLNIIIDPSKLLPSKPKPKMVAKRYTPAEVSRMFEELSINYKVFGPPDATFQIATYKSKPTIANYVNVGRRYLSQFHKKEVTLTVKFDNPEDVAQARKYLENIGGNISIERDENDPTTYYLTISRQRSRGPI